MFKKKEEIKKLILDVIDYKGQRVIFTQEKWKQKSLQHPELQNKKFLENLKKAIESPQIVWQDFDEPLKRLATIGGME